MADDTRWKFHTIGGLTIKIPSTVPTFTRGDLLRLNHGISFGDPCHNCQRPWAEEDYPVVRCPGCGALPQRVCSTRGCDAVIMPDKVQRENGKVLWYEGPSFCSSCSSSTSKGSRGSALHGVFPRKMMKYAKDYARLSAREDLDRTLHVWAVQQDLGRDIDETTMFVYGSRGSGKSVALARAGSAIYMKGITSSICYLDADEVYRATGDKYSDSPDVRGAARDLIERSRSMGLTIIDGLRLRSGITAAQRSEMTQIVQHRIRHSLPTILSQDIDSPDLSWLDGHLGEEIGECKWRVRCDCDAKSLTR